MYAIFIWTATGLIYGIISKLFDLKNPYLNLSSKVITGIIGGVVGGFVGRFILKTIHYDYLMNINNIIMSIVGAFTISIS